MGIYDVPKAELIEKVSQELKNNKEVKAPEWAKFAKTGVFKERPPVKEDWWHTRAASILLKIARLGPIGVSKLRKIYGGRKNRGVASEHFYEGSGNIIRKILQQFEKSGLIAKAQKGVHKGRILTPKGMSILGKTSNTIMKDKGIVILPKPKEAPKVHPTTQTAEPKVKVKRAPRKKKEEKKEEKTEEIKQQETGEVKK